MFWNENSQHENFDNFTQYIPASPLGYLREWVLEAAGKVCELLADLYATVAVLTLGHLLIELLCCRYIVVLLPTCRRRRCDRRAI